MADEDITMDEQDKRNIQVKFVCSRSELAQIDYSAKKAGMSRSEYMRTLMLHGNIEYHVNFSPEDAKVLLAALCEISNSVSVMSYTAWLNCTVDECDLRQVESTVEGLVKELGRLITG